MQADEVWKELDFLREQGAKTDLMLIGLKARSERLEHLFKGLPCNNHDERVATLEQVTAGPPEGPGFGQLEQRVAALEGLCAGCKEANELIESMPLPREG